MSFEQDEDDVSIRNDDASSLSETNNKISNPHFM